MKSTGVVRKIDELGRIVVPMELRRTLGIEVKDPVEFFVDGNQIILQKYQPNAEKVEVEEGLEKLISLSSNSQDRELLKRAIKLIR